MRISEILAKAADVIEEQGLHKGSLAAPSGAVCVFGAMQIACGGHVAVYGRTATVEGSWGTAYADSAKYIDYDRARYALQEHLAIWPSLWNDNPTVSQDMVVEELRQASAVEADKEAAA